MFNNIFFCILLVGCTVNVNINMDIMISTPYFFV
ncbi:hypothetical protein CZ814_00887 [Photobacterium toruni]|uniref:Uncharacterized protein n=1 Tax=Photobacterium toruni TaxID=1935446 RepID=A0A1T4PVG9_9GAMM|nr:hypothetical protein CZ814_00887 [Photobacterium toruni]